MLDGIEWTPLWGGKASRILANFGSVGQHSSRLNRARKLAVSVR